MAAQAIKEPHERVLNEELLGVAPLPVYCVFSTWPAVIVLFVLRGVPSEL